MVLTVQWIAPRYRENLVYLPAFVIIISVSSWWNSCHNSGFLRRAEIVFPSPSMAAFLPVKRPAAFCLRRFPRDLVDLKFRLRAIGARFEVSSREEHDSIKTTFGHAFSEAVSVGICSGDSKINFIFTIVTESYCSRKFRNPKIRMEF